MPRSNGSKNIQNTSEYRALQARFIQFAQRVESVLDAYLEGPLSTDTETDLKFSELSAAAAAAARDEKEAMMREAVDRVQAHITSKGGLPGQVHELMAFRETIKIGIDMEPEQAEVFMRIWRREIRGLEN